MGRVIHFVPFESNGQVSVVDELETLVIVLSMLGIDYLFDSCIDLTKLNRFAIQVQLGDLDLPKNLEEGRLRILDKDFEVLFNRLLCHAIRCQFD